MLHPNYPIIEGKYQMTDDWSVTLDQKHNRRFEDKSLVIWRPGFTIWTIVWNGKEGETPLQRFRSIRDRIPKESTGIVEETKELPYRLSYRLAEKTDDKRQPAFYGMVVGPTGHVQISIYFDDAKDLKNANEIFKSLTPTEAKSEQGGTGQPAPRPESESEGGDKPQPEAEGRSR